MSGYHLVLYNETLHKSQFIPLYELFFHKLMELLNAVVF